MGYRGYEFILQTVKLFQPLIGCPQFCGGILKFAGFFFKAMTVFNHLRSLIEDFHNFFNTDFLSFGHRGNHNSRRRPSYGPCQLPFSKANEICISLHFGFQIEIMFGCIFRKGLFRVADAHKTGNQAFEFKHGCSTTPQTSVSAAMTKHINKQGGLESLHGILPVKK